jgi:hypothetical protein
MNSTPGRHDVSPDFWNLNWSAIWAGAAMSLAIFVILALICTAIEFSAHTTYSINSRSGVESFTATTATWVAGLGIMALFIGGWVTGRIHRFGLRSACIHGLVLWGIAALFSITLLAGLVPLATREVQYFKSANTLADDMNLLADPQYKNDVLALVQRWQPEKNVIPEIVSSRTAERENPQAAVVDPELRSFIARTAHWNDQQIDTFVLSNQYDLAKSRDQAKTQWQDRHQQQLADADRERIFVATASWGLSGLAALALAAAIGGATLGRHSRLRSSRFRA